MQSTRIEGRWVPQGYQEVKRDDLPAVVYADWEHLHALAYKGRGKKHVWYYRFQSLAGMEQKINEFFNGVAAHEEYKKQQREERKMFVPGLIEGDILYTSWGYEQTNVEFFQVTGIKNKRVTLREIAGDTTETGSMSGNTKPVRGLWTGEPLTRTVQPGDRVKIDSIRNAYPLGDREQVSCSWYH